MATMRSRKPCKTVLPASRHKQSGNSTSTNWPASFHLADTDATKRSSARSIDT
jgi:hypothetical protein